MLSDYPVQRARAEVSEDNAPDYLNVADQTQAAWSVTYHRTDGTPHQADLMGATAPPLATWNIGGRLVACYHAYKGNPWVMPWLGPLTRRWQPSRAED